MAVDTTTSPSRRPRRKGRDRDALDELLEPVEDVNVREWLRRLLTDDQLPESVAVVD